VLELYDVIFGIALLVVGSCVFMFGISRHNPAKKGVKTAQDSISTMYSTYNQQVKDVLAIKDKQIKSLHNKIQQLEPELEQTTENTPLELGALEKLAQERGINPALLKNPVIQKLIKKYTKGMGIEEIIAIADQFGLLKGNKQSKPEDQAVGQNYANFF